MIADVEAAGRAERATFRHVFSVAEFRALWSAQMLSVAGDQLARVALTWLVYDRTRSALLAAVTFVASIVPTFVGSVTLSGLGDRLPRRQVMIACDLIRALLVVVMALPGMPVAGLVALLFTVTLVGAPFTSARAALYPDILTGDRYVLGTAVTITTYQFAQVVGFAAGGAIVGFFGVRASLLLDAITFVGSALIVRWWVSSTPPAGTGPARKVAPVADLMAGVRLVLRSPGLRIPLLFGLLSAFYNVPEGVVAPLAHKLGGGSITVGLLLASAALGAVIGSIAFSRLVVPAARLKAMGPLSVAASAVLVLFFLPTGQLLALLILMVSGLLTCFQLAANAAFVTAAPPAQRSQAFGLAQGGMGLGQGALMLLAGAAAEHFSPTVVIAADGVIGTVVAAAVAAAWSRRRHDHSMRNDHVMNGPSDRRELSAPACGAHGASPSQDELPYSGVFPGRYGTIAPRGLGGVAPGCVVHAFMYTCTRCRNGAVSGSYTPSLQQFVTVQLHFGGTPGGE